MTPDYRLRALLAKAAPWIGLASAVAFFALASGGGSLSARNLRTIAVQAVPILIVSCGAAFIYAHGGMDISQGGVIGVCALAATSLLNSGGSLAVAFALCLAVALAFGALSGVVTTKLGLPSFITSICVMTIARGIVAYGTASTSSIAVKVDLSRADSIALKSAVAAAVVAAAALLFRYARMGKYQKAMGGNIVAARQAGIPVDAYRIGAYLFAAAAVGVAAFFILAHSTAVSRNTGSGVEMDVMIALILGGMPLSGGPRSRIGSAVAGSLVVVVLGNGLIQWGVDPMLVQVVKGLAFLVVVSLTYKRTAGVLPR